MLITQIVRQHLRREWCWLKLVGKVVAAAVAAEAAVTLVALRLAEAAVTLVVLRLAEGVQV